jgi:hypothetical protein
MMRVVRVLADFLNYLLSVPAQAWSMCAVESARETNQAMAGTIPGESFEMCVESHVRLVPKLVEMCLLVWQEMHLVTCGYALVSI